MQQIERPNPAGKFISYVVFLPVSYYIQKRWIIPSNVANVGGMAYAQTSRLVTSPIGFEDAARKYIASIRNPLHGWRDVDFDTFVLQRRYYSDRTVKMFSVDEIIENYMATLSGRPLTPEFFERRKR